MIELKCESAPVASSPDFKQFANDLAKQLATRPGATTAEELLAQPSPSQAGQDAGASRRTTCSTASARCSRSARIVRFDGPCGGYAHHDGTLGVAGRSARRQRRSGQGHRHARHGQEAAVGVKEDSIRPRSTKEREILSAAARQGRQAGEHHRQNDRRPAEEFLRRQGAAGAAVRQGRHSRPSGQMAKKAGMKVMRFVRWELGKSNAAAEPIHVGRIARSVARRD